jgi:hypothetical protein
MGGSGSKGVVLAVFVAFTVVVVASGKRGVGRSAIVKKVLNLILLLFVFFSYGASIHSPCLPHTSDEKRSLEVQLEIRASPFSLCGRPHRRLFPSKLL